MIQPKLHRVWPVPCVVGLLVAAIWSGSFDAARGAKPAKSNEAADEALPDERFNTVLREAWDLYVLGDYPSAIDSYRRAATMAPRAVSPLLGMVNCHRAHGNADEAIRAAKAVLVIDSMNYWANRRLAELSYENANYAQAESYSRKLAALYPEDFDLKSLLGWCQYHRGRLGPARKLFDEVLAAAPNHPSALEGLAVCGPKISSK